MIMNNSSNRGNNKMRANRSNSNSNTSSTAANQQQIPNSSTIRNMQQYEEIACKTDNLQDATNLEPLMRLLRMSSATPDDQSAATSSSSASNYYQALSNLNLNLSDSSTITQNTMTSNHSTFKILDIQRHHVRRATAATQEGPAELDSEPAGMLAGAIDNDDVGNSVSRNSVPLVTANQQLNQTRAGGVNSSGQARAQNQHQQQKQQSGETLSSFESDYDLLVYLGETETEDIVDTERSLDYQDQTWRQSICGGASLAPTIDESFSELIGSPTGSEFRNSPSDFDLLNSPATPINQPEAGNSNFNQFQALLIDNQTTSQQKRLQRQQLSPTASAGLQHYPDRSLQRLPGQRSQIQPNNSNNNISQPFSVSGFLKNNDDDLKAKKGSSESGRWATNSRQSNRNEQLLMNKSASNFNFNLDLDQERGAKSRTLNSRTDFRDINFNHSDMNNNNLPTRSGASWNSKAANDAAELDRLLAEMNESLDLDSLARYDHLERQTSREPFNKRPADSSASRHFQIKSQPQVRQEFANWRQQPQQQLHRADEVGQKARGPSNRSILDEYNGASRMLEEMLGEESNLSTRSKSQGNLTQLQANRGPLETGSKISFVPDKRSELIRSINATTGAPLHQQLPRNSSDQRKMSTCSSSQATEVSVIAASPVRLSAKVAGQQQEGAKSIWHQNPLGNFGAPNREQGRERIIPTKVESNSEFESVVRKESSQSVETAGEPEMGPPPPPKVDYNEHYDEPDVIRVEATELPASDFESWEKSQSPDQSSAKAQGQMAKMKKRTLSSMRSMRNKFNDFMKSTATNREQYNHSSLQPTVIEINSERVELKPNEQREARRTERPQRPPRPPKRSSSFGSTKSQKFEEDLGPENRQRQERRSRRDTREPNERSSVSFGQQIRERLSRSKSRFVERFFGKTVGATKSKRAQSQPNTRNDELSATSMQSTIPMFQPSDIARNSQQAVEAIEGSETVDDEKNLRSTVEKYRKTSSASSTSGSSLSGLETDKVKRRAKSRKGSKRQAKEDQRKKSSSLLSIKRLGSKGAINSHKTADIGEDLIDQLKISTKDELQRNNSPPRKISSPIVGKTENRISAYFDVNDQEVNRKFSNSNRSQSMRCISKRSFKSLAAKDEPEEARDPAEQRQRTVSFSSLNTRQFHQPSATTITFRPISALDNIRLDYVGGQDERKMGDKVELQVPLTTADDSRLTPVGFSGNPLAVESAKPQQFREDPPSVMASVSPSSNTKRKIEDLKSKCSELFAISPKVPRKQQANTNSDPGAPPTRPPRSRSKSVNATKANEFTEGEIIEVRPTTPNSLLTLESRDDDEEQETGENFPDKGDKRNQNKLSMFAQQLKHSAAEFLKPSEGSEARSKFKGPTIKRSNIVSISKIDSCRADSTNDSLCIWKPIIETKRKKSGRGKEGPGADGLAEIGTGNEAAREDTGQRQLADTNLSLSSASSTWESSGAESLEAPALAADEPDESRLAKGRADLSGVKIEPTKAEHDMVSSGDGGQEAGTAACTWTGVTRTREGGPDAGARVGGRQERSSGPESVCSHLLPATSLDPVGGDQAEQQANEIVCDESAAWQRADTQQQQQAPVGIAGASGSMTESKESFGEEDRLNIRQQSDSRQQEVGSGEERKLFVVGEREQSQPLGAGHSQLEAPLRVAGGQQLTPDARIAHCHDFNCRAERSNVSSNCEQIKAAKFKFNSNLPDPIWLQREAAEQAGERSAAEPTTATAPTTTTTTTISTTSTMTVGLREPVNGSKDANKRSESQDAGKQQEASQATSKRLSVYENVGPQEALVAPAMSRNKHQEGPHAFDPCKPPPPAPIARKPVHLVSKYSPKQYQQQQQQQVPSHQSNQGDEMIKEAQLKPQRVEEADEAAGSGEQAGQWSIEAIDSRQLPLESTPAQVAARLRVQQQRIEFPWNGEGEEIRASETASKLERKMISMTSLIQDPNDELMMVATSEENGPTINQTNSSETAQQGPTRRDSVFSTNDCDNSDSDSSFASALASRRRLINRFEGKPAQSAETASRASSERPRAANSLVKRLAKNFDSSAQLQQQPSAPRGRPPPRTDRQPVVSRQIETNIQLADDDLSQASSSWYDAEHQLSSQATLDEAELEEFLRDFERLESPRSAKNSCAGPIVTEANQLEANSSVSTGIEPFVTVAESTLEGTEEALRGDSSNQEDTLNEEDTLNDEDDQGAGEDLMQDEEVSMFSAADEFSDADAGDGSGRARGGSAPIASDQGMTKTDSNSPTASPSANHVRLIASEIDRQHRKSVDCSPECGQRTKIARAAAPTKLQQPPPAGPNPPLTPARAQSELANNPGHSNCDPPEAAALAASRSGKAPARSSPALEQNKLRSPKTASQVTEQTRLINLNESPSKDINNQPQQHPLGGQQLLIDNNFKNSLNQLIANSSSSGPSRAKQKVSPNQDSGRLNMFRCEQSKLQPEATKGQENCKLLFRHKELRQLSNYCKSLLKNASKPVCKPPKRAPEAKPRAQLDGPLAHQSTCSSASISAFSSLSSSASSSPISSDDEDEPTTGDRKGAKLAKAANKCSKLYEELEKILASRAAKVDNQQQHQHQPESSQNQSSNDQQAPETEEGEIKQQAAEEFVNNDDEFGDFENLEGRGQQADLVSLSSSSISSESIPEVKQRQNLQKLYHVVNEICSSEANFVDTLKLLNEDFRLFISNSRCSGSGGSKCSINSLSSVGSSSGSNQQPGYVNIPPECLSSILKHLPQLQALNENLLAELVKAKEVWPRTQKIAHVLVKIGPFLKHYSTYIREFEFMQAQFQENLKKYPHFAEKVREFELGHKCKKLTIQHHLLKPIQRIPQYRLLLQQYLHYLKPSDVDYEDTVLALEVVSRVAEHANQSMKDGANFAKLLALQAKIIAGRKQLKIRNIIQPGRMLIKEGELMKICRKQIQPRWFVLLNDSLLYLTQIQSSDILYLNDELALDDCLVSVAQPASEHLGPHLETEFSVCTRTRSFALVAKSVQERDEWVSAIRQTVEEHMARRRSFSVKQQQARQRRLEQQQSQLLVDIEEPAPEEAPTGGALLGQKAPLWTPDSRATMCQLCTSSFSALFRRHHCRACGRVVCSACSSNRAPLVYRECRSARVCDQCFDTLRANIHLYYLPSLTSSVAQLAGRGDGDDEEELRKLDKHFKRLLKSQFIRHAGVQNLNRLRNQLTSKN